MFVLIVITGLFLAFSNGANDNFKGVATLLGSKTTSYRVALLWATFSTAAGSLAAFYFAQKLMVNFSGKGLVPDEIAQMTSFSVSVALAAALTVLLATKFGFPISTTHALTGALVGSGLMATAGGVNFNQLTNSFLLPLLLSPLISIIGASTLYPILSYLRRRIGVTRETCLCIGNEVMMKAPAGVEAGASTALLQMLSYPQVTIDTQINCEERYVGQVWGFNSKLILDSAHFLSAGLLSFARGLNDTPKIAAILVVGNFISPLNSLMFVAIVMGLGGIIFARRIADTMAYQITEMNDGQGFSANLITSLVVVGASRFGVPVSTTHVSCGSLFGIGMVTGKAQWRSIFKILLSWIVTLPVSAILSYVLFSILREVL